MSGFASPDLPAHWCYAIVLIVGALAGRSTVDQLLSDHRDRWGFLGTWSLLVAHSLLPVGLFWFLDYTAVIQDTSLFAALVVALGYRQIFAGGIRGIKMPGQTSGLWKPFEAWVNRVADKIATKNKLYRDRFDESVRMLLAETKETVKKFEDLVAAHTEEIANDPIRSELDRLKAKPDAPGARRRQVRILWNAFRAAAPESYGHFLRDEKLIGWAKYFWWRSGRSRIVPFGIAGLALLIIAQTAPLLWAPDQGEMIRLRYHHWRFTKVTASERDVFRSREYLGEKLATLDVSSRDTPQNAAILLSPLIGELGYAALSPDMADRILRLVMDFHSPAIDTFALPELFESLRTENADVRLRIQRTLLDLRAADYPDHAVDPELMSWTPQKDERAGQIDEHIRMWRQWMSSAHSAAKTEPSSQQ